MRICRERAAREGWQIIEVYMDAAISGASMILRPDIKTLLVDAQEGHFDIVLIDGYAKGLLTDADLGTRVHDLRAERDRCQAELNCEKDVPNVVTLHPAAGKTYEERLAKLSKAVNRGIEAGDGESAAALRNLVHAVTVFRDSDSPRGLRIEISGALNALIHLQMSSGKNIANGRSATYPHTSRTGVGIGGSGGGIHRKSQQADSKQFFYADTPKYPQSYPQSGTFSTD